MEFVMSVVLPINAPQSDHDQACLVELMKLAAALAREINHDRFLGVVPDDEATVTLCKTLDICLSILGEE
jgi:hypothetical protein